MNVLPKICHTSRNRPLLAMALAIVALCATQVRADTIVFADGDYTEDIYLAARTDTFVVDGNTTISGRITGTAASSKIATGGAFTKTGDGTLTITGERNWFLGPNTVETGTLAITHVGALGMGNLAVNPGATFVFSGIRDGALFPQAITGGGRVEVIDSDLTLNYRHGYVIGALPTADHVIGQLAVTRSRFHALASGTQSSGLGGSGAVVTIADHSTLLLGREGVSAGVSGLLAPVNYATFVRNLGVDATSALVLNPGANLTVTGTLALAPGSVFTFGGAGVSRLEFAALDPASADPDTLVTVPAGYSLDVTPISGEGGRQRRDYLVINQGANPMHDIAMTLGVIDTTMDIVGNRLNELFLMPAAESSRQRRSLKWANTAWARFASSKVVYDADSVLRPGHDGRLNSLIIGLDSAYRMRVNFGFYGSLSESNLDTTNATSLSSKQRFFGVSITPRFKRFYLTVDMLAGNADSEALRHEANGSTIAQWDNKFLGGGIEAGTVLNPWKNGFLRPRVALRYTVVDVGGYTERAPMGASPMRLESFTDSLAHFNLAIEAAHRIKLFKRDVLLGASVGCKRYMQEPRVALDATFSDYPTRGFTLERGDYYEDAVSVGASLNMAVSLRTRAGLALDYELGSNHERLTASLVVNYIW